MSASLSESAKAAFQELYAEVPELRGMIVLTSDGLPLIFDIKSDLSADRFAAIAASALTQGRKLMNSLEMGELTDVVYTSQEGKLFLYQLGSSAALCVLAPKDLNLGMLLYRIGATIKKLSAIL